MGRRRRHQLRTTHIRISPRKQHQHNLPHLPSQHQRTIRRHTRFPWSARTRTHPQQQELKHPHQNHQNHKKRILRYPIGNQKHRRMRPTGRQHPRLSHRQIQQKPHQIPWLHGRNHKQGRHHLLTIRKCLLQQQQNTIHPGYPWRTKRKRNHRKENQTLNQTQTRTRRQSRRTTIRKMLQTNSNRKNDSRWKTLRTNHHQTYQTPDQNKNFPNKHRHPTQRRRHPQKEQTLDRFFRSVSS